jgi:enterochelin esterase-like enzyme
LAFVDVFVEEIVPFVERTYPTVEEPHGRALLARNTSTYASVYITFTHP